MERVQVIFGEEMWRILRVVMEMKGAGGVDLAEAGRRAGSQAVHNALGELRKWGFLVNDDSYCLSEIGEIAYERHLRWWRALRWDLRRLDTLPEVKDWLADRALCSAGADWIQEKTEQYMGETGGAGEADEPEAGRNWCMFAFENGQDMGGSRDSESRDIWDLFEQTAEHAEGGIKLTWRKNGEQLLGIASPNGEEAAPKGKKVILPLSMWQEVDIPSLDLDGRIARETVITLRLKPGKNQGEPGQTQGPKPERSLRVKLLCLLKSENPAALASRLGLVRGKPGPQHPIEIQFKEEQWQCFRTLCQMPGDTGRTQAALARRLEKTPRAVRRLLDELTQKGYITEDGYEITLLGKEAYQQHMAWWKALLWSLREWELPKESKQQMADHMLCATDAGFVKGILEQYEHDRMRDIPKAAGTVIDDTDFLSQIPEGVYHVGFCLLDEEGEENLPFMKISGWQASFERQARLVIEAGEGRLELEWKDRRVTLESVGYWLGIREEYQRAKGEERVISLPLKAMSFEYVPAYRILEGEMKLILCISEIDDGQIGLTERCPLILKLSLLR